MSGKFALLLGNDQYEDSHFGELTVPRNDVEALEKLLLDPDIGCFDQVKVLLNGSLETIMEAVGDLFSGRSKDDLLLLYFSGHGALDNAGQLHLALKKTRYDRLSGTGIWAPSIKNIMNTSRSRRQVLILDCCHSGAFGRDASGSKDTLEVPAIDERTFDVKGYGREILVSSSATQASWEGNKVIDATDKSLFTHFLVEGLETGKAASNGDTEITVGDLYEYVHDRVIKSHPQMTPQRFVDRQEGSIVIARNPKPVVQPKLLPEKLLSALENSEPFIREGAVTELGRLINGKDEGLSRAARMCLETRQEQERDIHVKKAIDEVLEKPTRSSPESNDVSKPRTESQPKTIVFGVLAIIAIFIAVFSLATLTGKPEVENLEEQKKEKKTVEDIDPSISQETPVVVDAASPPRIKALLNTCEIHFEANRLTKGRGGNALDCYEKVLKQESGNALALAGLKKIEARYQGWFAAAMKKGSHRDLEAVKRHLEGMKRVNPESPNVASAEEELAKRKAIQAKSVTDKSRQLKQGDGFRDTLKHGSKGPEMIVIPAGSFTMGSPKEEAGRRDDEGPQHFVKISKRFAIGKHEVTVGDFKLFVQTKGYKTQAQQGSGCWVYENDWKKDKSKHWLAPGFAQNDQHPLVCVSWNDAKAYIGWLSKQSGKAYRLPTEAEWEHVARAGSKTSRYWGDKPGQACRFANVADQTAKEKFAWSGVHECPDGYIYTAPVGKYSANDFAVKDILGNVGEWSQDCARKNYEKAPSDGSAWTAGNCGLRVVRGGSWGGKPGACALRPGPGSSPASLTALSDFAWPRTYSPFFFALLPFFPAGGLDCGFCSDYYARYNTPGGSVRLS